MTDKPTNQQPHNSLTPPPASVISRKVHIRVVEEISEYDFPQATKAWQALEDAGIDPGSLVANALEHGHDYKSKEMLITQPFQNSPSTNNPAGESAISQDRLVGYSYVNSQDLKLLSTPQPGDGLEVVLQSQEVATINNEDPKAIKMTAVLRRNSKQIAPNKLTLDR